VAQKTDSHHASRALRVRNLALAAVAAQAGCVTVIIITVVLLAGLWLDAQAGRRGLFTILLLVLSVPLTLFLMVRIALGAVSRIQAHKIEDHRMNEEDAR
jgi:hypothetical protein